MGHINLALLGVLGLVQVVFLPGYLLLRIMRAGGGVIATAALSFALSLLVNYCLVAALVVVGLYRPAVVYAVFAAEVLLWLRLDYRRLGSAIGPAFAAAKEQTRAFVRDIDRHCPIQSHLLRRAMLATAVLVIGGFGLAGIAETGQIFQQWDAVVSWNRWAVDWAANRLPLVTSYYPQLLPANASLSYVVMQTSEVWIFAKAMQFLFCLMILLTMLDAARRLGNFGLMPGVAITYGLFVALLRYRMISSGYADVPLAFFAWMPIYALLLANGCDDQIARSRYLLAGALLAAGAALTKQMGMYVALVYPLLAWVWPAAQTEGEGEKGRRGEGEIFRRLPFSLSPLLPFFRSPANIVRDSLRLYLIIAALVVPWYAYKYADIRAGHDENNTPKLVHDFHEGRGVPARFMHAAAAVAEATTLPGGILLLVMVTASLRDPRCRWLVGVFVVPLGLLWAAAFSYDLRNLAMLVPFLGAAAGMGLVRIICWVQCGMERSDGGAARRQEPAFASLLPFSLSPPPPIPKPRFGTLRTGHVTAFLTVTLLAAALCISNDSLLALQRRQQRRVGSPPLNAKVYAYAESHPGMTYMASDYLAMRWLPELAPRTIVCSCQELAVFRRTFDRPDVGYVLVRSADLAAEVRQFLARPSVARLIFADQGFVFYQKVRPSV